MHAFMSHNHRDKPHVTPFAARMKLAGAEVWLDEWEIHPGDSIIGKVNEALDLVDTVLLFWSRNAAESAWVNTEMETALTRKLSDGSVRVIPMRLDDAPLPPLLRPLMYVSLEDGADVDAAVRRILGIDSQAELLKAMQQTLWDAGIQSRDFRGMGVMVACPKCGATPEALDGRVEIDHERDDLYMIVTCKQCGWSDGCETW
ncbi:Predicted nucleic-acid-binding protein, contains Zn-ribbon domain [Streptomyces sp. 2231.1]|uniref:toll/interleukin-1 receptor domain-containing protein n=1 Tax=Streptomyces sp. 2231.1 TaxID=1855347 RepID=UPI000898673C|nr:TIR domain-containing protein [Streptomyces sp. 2231.1]SEE65527.1 Predicted nucleic-acid-binding protein, contains Zn-ribbon domain [Streptomyces sp. 2231.1]